MDIDEVLQPLTRNRKRAASSPAPTNSHDHDSSETHSSAVRARLTSDLDDLGVIPTDQSWDVDLDSVLEQHHETHDDDAVAGAEQWPDGRMDDVSEAMMRNLRAMDRDMGIVVLCVLGGLDGQYWLLKALLPVLRMITPALRFYALAVDIASRTARLSSDAFGQKHWAYLGLPVGSDVAVNDIPFVQPSNASRTFTRLGLLHPLGGGKEPLDAIIVLDCRASECKRRLVLPFGWGAGRHVADEAGGWMVRGRMMEILREGLEQIAREQRDGR